MNVLTNPTPNGQRSRSWQSREWLAGASSSTWCIGSSFMACSPFALTLGVLCGYVAYAITHHAIHHWRVDSAWLRRRQRWHFIHHSSPRPCCYGVTSGIWDTACRSARPDRKSTTEEASD